MCAFLETPRISQWIEHHAERRGDKWILSESLLKMLPISERFTKVIAQEASKPEIRAMAATLAKDPESVTTIASLSPEHRYIVMANALLENDWGMRQIRPFMGPEGRIDWTKILGLFRAQDSVPLTQHPLVRIAGQVPVNSPITKLDRLKSPQNGLLIMTESGALQKVLFDHRMLAEMAWDQSKMLAHPTWGELAQSIRLPRALEVAEAAALDIMTSHDELNRKRRSLLAWLSAGIPEA
jgi:hypothetical protein